MRSTLIGALAGHHFGPSDQGSLSHMLLAKQKAHKHMSWENLTKGHLEALPNPTFAKASKK